MKSKVIESLHTDYERLSKKVETIDELKKSVVGRCKDILLKLIRSGMPLDFSKEPITFMSNNLEYRIIRIDKTDNIFNMNIMNIYNLSGDDVNIKVDELNYDEILKLTNKLYGRFERIYPSKSDLKKLTERISEIFDLCNTRELFCDITMECGYEVKMITRDGKFLHFYDGHPNDDETNEIRIYDDDMLCEVLSAFVNTF